MDQTTPHSAREWNELWQARQQEHTMDHDAAYWNERARTFSQKDSPDSYVERFLALTGVRPTDSIFDMGCGTGNLSIPLGQQGHEVLAADFSSVMLERLQTKLNAEHIRTVRTMELSWEDDWQAKGVEPGSFDICVASRSIAANDLQGALEKLSATARRRICITLSTGASPRIHGRMLQELGLPWAPGFDAVYAIGILIGLGFEPELTYIHTSRNDRFESMADAEEKYLAMVKGALGPAATSQLESVRPRLRRWLEDNLTSAADPRNPQALQLNRPREVSWAFIAWNKQL